MARMEIKGIEEYANQIAKLNNVQEYAGRILYKGAKVMADAMDNAIDKIPEEKEYKNGLPRPGSKKAPLKGITKTQRKDLHDGLGIAPKQIVSNDVNLKVGFDGYGSIPTAAHPKGLPNNLLARAVTSGSSFRRKTPILRTTVVRTKQKVLEAMNQEAEKVIKEKFEK